MTASGYKYGHRIIWAGGHWVYADTRLLSSVLRTCPRCGEPPTVEGYDACVGKVQGAVSVCCGHGVEKGYIVLEGERP